MLYKVVAVAQWLSLVRLFVTHGLKNARLLCPLPLPEVCSDSCPLVGDAICPSHPLLPILLLPV